MTAASLPARSAARPRSPFALLATGVMVVLAGAAPLVRAVPLAEAVPRSLALLMSTDSVTGGFAADVLLPPTDLAATGGATIVLAWTPTASGWASGYTVWRSTSASGPYTEVASVTPRSATGFEDSPVPGTYHYVVRATHEDWSSAEAGPVSATIASAQFTTGFQDCAGSSNAAVTTAAGDGNGYESNPARACGFDGLFAQDASSGTGGSQSCGTGVTPDARKDQHDWWGFALGLPDTVASIDGIEVQARLRLNNNGGTTNLCIQLSWDEGASWTAIQALDVAGGNDWTTYTFGSGTDTWGRSWTLGELDAPSLRVRVIAAAAQSPKTFQLDGLRVQVTYTP